MTDADRDAAEFARILRAATPGLRKWMGAAVRALAADSSGEVLEAIARALSGELVVENYVDSDTGELRTLADNEPVPPRCLPLLPGMVWESGETFAGSVGPPASR